MREKIGALIQFLAVIIAFAMVLIGVCDAYNTYFKAAGEINASGAIFDSVVLLIVAVVGAAIGVVGVLFGNILKK